MMHHHHQMGAGPATSVIDPTGGVDTDPRELEAFAERFKQRRIKLGKCVLNVRSNVKTVDFLCLLILTVLPVFENPLIWFYFKLKTNKFYRVFFSVYT